MKRGKEKTAISGSPFGWFSGWSESGKNGRGIGHGQLSLHRSSRDRGGAQRIARTPSGLGASSQSGYTPLMCTGRGRAGDG